MEPGDFEKVVFVLVNQLRTFYEKLDLTKWSFIVFSGETAGKLLRRIPNDPGSTGSDNPSFQYPPVPGGDLSDSDLNEPGSPTPFDVDDEDMFLGHSHDPPGPGPPGSGPYGGGPYGPVPSQPLVDTPFPMEYEAEIPGLPVTEGEFPVAQSPVPDTPGEQAAPDSDSDSDATNDYEGQGFSI